MSLSRHLSDKKENINFYSFILAVQENSQSTEEKAMESILPQIYNERQENYTFVFDSTLSKLLTGYSSPIANSNA